MIILDIFFKFCCGVEKRVQTIDDVKQMPFFSQGIDWEYIRERPPAIPVFIKSIDDTSNFDDFPDVDLKIPSAATNSPSATAGPKDWVFTNYTFRRFEGLNPR